MEGGWKDLHADKSRAALMQEHGVDPWAPRVPTCECEQPRLGVTVPKAAPPAPGQPLACLQLGWAAPGRPPGAFQLDIKAVSKNKQTTSGAEGREAVPVGCLGSTSAIQSGPLGCEGNGRESIMGRVFAEGRVWL